MALQLRCPKCRKAFRWTASAGFPDQCPLCNEDVGGNRADDDIVIPFIRSAKTDRTDQVYRDIERGSEVRAELGAQAAGCSVSDMAALKITDMRDNQREGDIAAKLVPTPDEGKFFQPNGAEYAAGTANGTVTLNGQVTTGIQPRAGMKAMQSIQSIMGKSA